MSRRTNTAVWLEKQGRWQINVQKDGVRRSFYSLKPDRNGQRECNKRADQWLEENLVPSSVKVVVACDEFMQQIEDTTGTSNKVNTSYYIRCHIIPAIGNIKVKNVTETQLQNIINAGYKKKLAKKTLTGLKQCISQLFKFCRSSGYTKLFPENLHVPKSAPVKRKRILQPEDIKTVFTSTESYMNKKVGFDTFIYAYRFSVVTGLRPGELLGLKWKDYRSNGMLDIRRAVNKYNETTEGKNDNALRTFKVIDTAATILEEQRQLLMELNIESEYIFPDKYGDCLKQSAFYKRWCNYRKHNNIQLEVSPYELRHTFVSMVKDLPVGLLKDVVGHSQSMDTFGVYSHQFADDRNRTADMIQNIVNEILG
jgi:integrase